MGHVNPCFGNRLKKLKKRKFLNKSNRCCLCFWRVDNTNTNAILSTFDSLTSVPEHRLTLPYYIYIHAVSFQTKIRCTSWTLFSTTTQPTAFYRNGTNPFEFSHHTLKRFTLNSLSVHPRERTHSQHCYMFYLNFLLIKWPS